MEKWFQKLFKTRKPIIAMAHIPALPGSPRCRLSLEETVKWVKRDVKNLSKARVDAVLFCNEDDRPYALQASPEQVAAMTRVVVEARPISGVFGVDVLWDPYASMAVAHATGAHFVRGVFTGVYESDMGLWSPDASSVARLRRRVGAEGVRMFFNIVPEFASPLGGRSPAERALSAQVSSLADVLLVSGHMAGAEADLETLREVKKASNVPVLVNTGVNEGNLERYLEVADGAIVGTSLKQGGYTWGPVDPERAKRFMEKARSLRRHLDQSRSTLPGPPTL